MIPTVEYIMLCGGIGSRLNQSLFPKPMTMIAGRALFNRVLESLSLDAITFVVNSNLKAYNFQALVNKSLVMKKMKTKFWYLPFETRGALESLYLYLKEFPQERQIVVLDNDNLYDFGYLSPYSCGIFYVEDDSVNQKSESFSFITTDDGGGVIDISEKDKISNKVCVGYYMNDIKTRLDQLYYLINNIQLSEFYLSSLYKLMLSEKTVVIATKITAFILGTIDDIQYSDKELQRRDMIDQPSAVFDIDNTLIDTDGSPITEQLDFARYLKSRGWKIILYTARGMKWSPTISELAKDKVKRDIDGLLDYDELHFNKPYGEIYIDDKAFNPYDDRFYEKLGFFHMRHQYQSQYTSKTSKANTITRSSYNTIIKQSTSSLDAETNFYKVISKTIFSIHFPAIIDHSPSSIEIEYIPGPTFSNLFNEDLLTEELFIKLLDLMDYLHSSNKVDDVEVTKEDITSFYMTKFYERKPLVEHLLSKEEIAAIEYIALTHSNKSYELSNIIHGDLWFRNILIYKRNIKLIDMRGKIGNKITVKGDKFYDYAKLYQSLLGMDNVLIGKSYNKDNQLRKIFEVRYKQNIKLIHSLSLYTIFCSLPSWNETEQHNLIDLLRSEINELGILDTRIQETCRDC